MIKKISVLIALLFISTSAMAQWFLPKKPRPPQPYTYDSYNQDPQGAAKIKEAQKAITEAIDAKKKDLNTPANLPPPLKWTGVPELSLPPPTPIRNNSFTAPTPPSTVNTTPQTPNTPSSQINY